MKQPMIGDVKLGLSRPARIIMAKLGKIPLEKKNLDVSSFAFYNCREICAGLWVRNSDFSNTRYLFILFGEHRSSEDIILDHWESTVPRLNPPTVADFTDAAYDNREYFEPDDIDGAIQAILKLMNDFSASIASPAKGKRPLQGK